MEVLIIQILSLLFAVCNSASVNPLWRGFEGGRIVGGENADRDEFPFQVSLRSRASFGMTHFCGGAVLDENFVITAAHCCSGHSPSNVHVVAGGVKLFLPEGVEERRDVEKIIMHPDYESSSTSNDICLLKLSSPLDFKPGHVASIRLPNQNQTIEEGTECIVTGWGTLTEGALVASSHLQKVTVPVVSNENCRKAYGGYKIDESMMCAGYKEGGKDSCQGDSGGPLFSKDSKVLLGIVSWGQGCARPDYPGVYCNVAHFVHWILDTIKM